MFCPNCALEVTENIKFCKRCGSNLTGLREALTRGSKGATGGFDWSKTWVADMLMNPGELDRVRGVNPEVKRYHEIKAGVITACIGIGVTIFLAIFMQGIAESHPQDAVILERVWVAGIIPLMIGLGLIINGVFVSKRMNKAIERNSLPPSAVTPLLPNTSTNPLDNRTWESDQTEVLGEPRSSPSPPDFSVAEPATQRMPDSSQK
jgi:hypothetical protein